MCVVDMTAPLRERATPCHTDLSLRWGAQRSVWSAAEYKMPPWLSLVQTHTLMCLGLCSRVCVLTVVDSAAPAAKRTNLALARQFLVFAAGVAESNTVKS